MEFTYKNWIEPFSNEDYAKILLQVRKLIGAGKKHREASASDNSKQKAFEITRDQQEQQGRRVAIALQNEIQGAAIDHQEKSVDIVEYAGKKVVGTGDSFGGKQLKKRTSYEMKLKHDGYHLASIQLCLLFEMLLSSH